MSFRPKTAQAQRQDRGESSIPIPRTKSIPVLRRQLPSQATIPPVPLGISRIQSQVPIPRQVGISRKPSIPLRSGLPPVETQVNKKVSTTRLRSAPIVPPINGRDREKKPLPTRAGLDLTHTHSHTNHPTDRDWARAPYPKRTAPPSPSINSVPIVNRLSRKASIPIIARATYITPPGLKFGKSNVKEKKVEDIFQGGPSIKPKDEVEVERPGVQKMMMRGNKIERPDYLGQGQELQDMSIDLNGTPSPSKPTGKSTNRPPIPSMNHQFPPRMNNNETRKDFQPRSQLARSPLKNNNHPFEFNSPIRPTRSTHPEATPLFPRWPKDNGYIVDVDEMSMLGEESFRFTGDSIEITSPPLSTTATVTGVELRLNRKGEEGIVEQNTKVEDLGRLKQEEEMKMIEGQLKTITLERDDALLQQEKGMKDIKEMGCRELRRGIVLELERCGEYRGWLDGLRALVAKRGGLK